MCCESLGRFPLFTKLGRCGTCMRRSAFGALAAWIVAAIVLAATSPVAVEVAALVVAGAFSALWLAHVAAAARRLATRNAVRWETRESGENVLLLERRTFLASGVALAVALLGLHRIPAALAQDRKDARYCVYVVNNAVAAHEFDCPHEEGDVLCVPCPPQKSACDDTTTCICSKIVGKEEKQLCTLTLFKIRGYEQCGECPFKQEFETVDAKGKAKKVKPKVIDPLCKCSNFAKP